MLEHVRRSMELLSEGAKYLAQTVSVVIQSSKGKALRAMEFSTRVFSTAKSLLLCVEKVLPQFIDILFVLAQKEITTSSDTVANVTCSCFQAFERICTYLTPQNLFLCFNKASGFVSSGLLCQCCAMVVPLQDDRGSGISSFIKRAIDLARTLFDRISSLLNIKYSNMRTSGAVVIGLFRRFVAFTAAGLVSLIGRFAQLIDVSPQLHNIFALLGEALLVWEAYCTINSCDLKIAGEVRHDIYVNIISCLQLAGFSVINTDTEWCETRNKLRKARVLTPFRTSEFVNDPKCSHSEWVALYETNINAPSPLPTLPSSVNSNCIESKEIHLLVKRATSVIPSLLSGITAPEQRNSFGSVIVPACSLLTAVLGPVTLPITHVSRDNGLSIDENLLLVEEGRIMFHSVMFL